MIASYLLLVVLPPSPFRYNPPRTTTSSFGKPLLLLLLLLQIILFFFLHHNEITTYRTIYGSSVLHSSLPLCDLLPMHLRHDDSVRIALRCGTTCNGRVARRTRRGSCQLLPRFINHRSRENRCEWNRDSIGFGHSCVAGRFANSKGRRDAWPPGTLIGEGNLKRALR